MSNESTALQGANQRPPTIRGLLEGPAFRAQVAKALPRHLTPDRFIRVACTTMMRVPKLAQCEQASFFNALLTLSQLGLEPDGRRAHLIPFGKECQLIIDYKGLVELAMRSGNVAKIHADVVCENDFFQYDRGEIKAHQIDFKKPRGLVYAAYAICQFKDGTEKAEVMNREEIDAVRKRSKAGQNGPWVTDWNEMAKKTVFRRLSKWLPLSPEYRDALDVDADTIDNHASETFDTSAFVPAPVNPLLPPPATEEEAAPADQSESPATTPENAEPKGETDPPSNGASQLSHAVLKFYEAVGGDLGELERLSAYAKDDGGQVPGVRSWSSLSDGRAKSSLGRWEREQKARYE
jgi:recombination protein RecT